MIVILIIPILLGAVLWALIRAARTVGPAWRDSDHDAAWCLVVLASSWMPKDSQGWSAAMRAEFGSVDGRGARWHFALGCLRAALLPTRRIGAGGRRPAGAVITALVACTALQVYGRVRFPTGAAGGAGYVGLFVIFVAVGAWMALFDCQTTSANARVARRYGTAGGLAAGALYVVAVTPSPDAGYAALLGIGCAIAAGAMATRASGDPRTAVRAGVWVGLISGSVFFIGLMTLTYAAAGWWTHDHEAVSVFNGYGPLTQRGHSLAQWPGFAAFLVRRESAVALLGGFVLAPLLAIAAGAVGGAVAGVIGGRRDRWGRLATARRA